MKYMTFNSSCSYAGLANMLERYGVDTDDRSIAMEMKLPYLFAGEDGIYLAGPMLQSAEWFNLYLRPIGFEMRETMLPAERVPEFLKQQKTAMLGLRVDGSGKHAVVYLGRQDGTLVFLNNKWEQTEEPERLTLTEKELLERLDDMTVIASLKAVPPKAVDLTGRILNSERVIRRNIAEIRAICDKVETVGRLRAKLNTLFRPMLLDGITMLELLGERDLAHRFSALQRRFLSALRQPTDTEIVLGNELNMAELSDAAEEYIRLIRQAAS